MVVSMHTSVHRARIRKDWALKPLKRVCFVSKLAVTDVHAYVMETGWSPFEGHPFYNIAIIMLLSDIKHLINT